MDWILAYKSPAKEKKKKNKFSRNSTISTCKLFSSRSDENRAERNEEIPVFSSTLARKNRTGSSHFSPPRSVLRYRYQSYINRRFMPLFVGLLPVNRTPVKRAPSSIVLFLPGTRERERGRENSTRNRGRNLRSLVCVGSSIRDVPWIPLIPYSVYEHAKFSKEQNFAQLLSRETLFRDFTIIIIIIIILLVYIFPVCSFILVLLALRHPWCFLFSCFVGGWKSIRVQFWSMVEVDLAGFVF